MWLWWTLRKRERNSTSLDSTLQPSERRPWGNCFAWQPCCPIASVDLGQWLCVPPFQMVCPCQSITMYYNGILLVKSFFEDGSVKRRFFYLDENGASKMRPLLSKPGPSVAIDENHFPPGQSVSTSTLGFCRCRLGVELSENEFHMGETFFHPFYPEA